jgi:hypothetical protein
MAISASSRMRECGTASAEAATDGPNLVSGLDTLEDRRSWDAEAGQYGGISERVVALKFLGAACRVEDSYHAPLRIDDPDGFAAVREIKLDLILEARGGL